MSAARTLIEEAAARGARVYLRDGQLKVAFRGEPPRDLLDKLRTHKPDILRALAPPAPVASLEERRADVNRLLAAMAAENERRRDWHTKPVEGWRDGRLVLRSAMTGQTNVILLPKRGRS
jgi:hypothetical protein